MKTEDRKKLGKKSRAQGNLFEKKVRDDLENKGWIVDKWTNQVEFGHNANHDGSFTPVVWKDLTLNNGKHYPGPNARLIKAKTKWAGPGRPMMMGSGFPDFIAIKQFQVNGETDYATNEKQEEVVVPFYKGIFYMYENIGVESKMTGILDAEEKEKCRWLLRNKVFSKILIASKKKEGRKIVVEYREFISK